jgi:hypothetical protein
MLLVRLRVGIGDERFDLFRRGRETDQVEVDPPDQRAPVGLGRGR